MHLLQLYSKYSSTQRAILQSVKAFCQRELLPRVRTDYKHEQTDRKLFEDMGSLGILGPTLSSKHGCLGESYMTYGLIAKEIESVDSGYRSMFSVQSSLVMYPIAQFGSATVQKQYLEALRTGSMVGCFGLTEPNAGSDPSSMAARAFETESHYVLHGTKTWISNAPIADVFVVWAKMDGIVHGFVLDRSMAGISTSPIEGKLSLRTSVTGMIYLDGVEVPKSHKLAVYGMAGPFSCLNSARLGISFGVLGAAETCIEKTLHYAADRTVFGEPLVKKQLFQMKMANMVTEYNLALLACMHVAEYAEQSEKLHPEMVSLVKRNSCEKALQIVRTCRDVLGGNGISEDYDVFRHLCNLETVSTYEGTHDIHTLILGSHVCKEKAF